MTIVFATLEEVRREVERFSLWLQSNAPTVTPNTFDKREPGLGYRRCVEVICNDGVLGQHWDHSSFQRGVAAVGLLALKAEGLALTGSPVELVLVDGTTFTISEFVSGATTPQYQTPEFADLDRRVVPTVGLALQELGLGDSE